MVGMREKPATFLVLAGGSRWFTCSPTGSKTVGQGLICMADRDFTHPQVVNPVKILYVKIRYTTVAPSFETDHHRICLVNCSVFSL